MIYSAKDYKNPNVTPGQNTKIVSTYDLYTGNIPSELKKKLANENWYKSLQDSLAGKSGNPFQRGTQANKYWNQVTSFFNQAAGSNYLLAHPYEINNPDLQQRAQLFGQSHLKGGRFYPKLKGVITPEEFAKRQAANKQASEIDKLAGKQGTPGTQTPPLTNLPTKPVQQPTQQPVQADILPTKKITNSKTMTHYKPGVIGFYRIPQSADPNKVYAIGPGGKPIDSPQELMQYTGEPTVAKAFSHVQVVTPEEAYAKGIRAPGITPGTQSKTAAPITNTWTPGYPGSEALKAQQAQIEKQLQQKQKTLKPNTLAPNGVPADNLIPPSSTTPPIDTSDLQATVTSAKNKFAQIQQDMQQNTQNYLNQLKSQGQAQQSWLKKAIGSFKGIQTKSPDYQALFEDTLKKYGITPQTFQKQQDLINQIEAKNMAIAQIDQKYAAKKAELQRAGMPQDYITRKGQYYDRLAAIEKAGIAAEASALSAQYQAMNGNINEAKSLADRAVQYATAGYQQNINDFKTLFNLKSDVFNSMSKNERAIWDLAYQWNQNQLKLKQTQLTDVMNLMIKYPNAGITVNDTPQEAAAKAAEYGRVTRVVGSAYTGYNLIQYSPKTGQVERNTPLRGGIRGRGGGTVMTSEYKNYLLAGGQKGTGKTYAQWLDRNRKHYPVTPLKELPIEKQINIKKFQGWLNTGTIDWNYVIKNIPKLMPYLKPPTF